MSKYQSEEERKAARRESQRRWKEKNLDYFKKYYLSNTEKFKQYRQDNSERIKEYGKQYRQDNSEQIKEKHNQYLNTQMGRASNLISAYNQSDREANRGKGDLTAEWIVENIFSQPCKHCGKTGWEIIGCNRIDNDKPHTKDNVEPCCWSCNSKLARL